MGEEAVREINGEVLLLPMYLFTRWTPLKKRKSAYCLYQARIKFSNMCSLLFIHTHIHTLLSMLEYYKCGSNTEMNKKLTNKKITLVSHGNLFLWLATINR